MVYKVDQKCCFQAQTIYKTFFAHLSVDAWALIIGPLYINQYLYINQLILNSLK